MAEPSVDPSLLLNSVRVFLREAVRTAGADQQARQHEPDTEEGALGFEEAGCLVWDCAALTDDAAFLVQQGLLEMLPPALQVAAAQQRWRALEVGLGILGNLACHAAAKQQLLLQPAVPELLLDRLVWVDDAASLAELCRCVTSLLTDSGQAAEGLWAVLLKEENLGRVVWIVENTLNSVLLERVLNLLAVMVTACPTAAHSSSAGSSQQQKQELVPQLLSLDLIPLLASVLLCWLAQLRQEQRRFGRASSEGATSSGGTSKHFASQGSSAGATPSAGASLPSEPQHQQQQEALGVQCTAEQATLAEPASEGSPQAPALAAGLAVAAGGAGTGGSLTVAAEVTEAAALEALAVLEALAADPAGEVALGTSDLLKDALLGVLSESEHSGSGMQALSCILLAGLPGVATRLLQHPEAVSAALAGLDNAARRLQQGGAAQPAASTQGQQAGEEVEAAWALCSSLAHALSQVAGVQELPACNALTALQEYADLLALNWGRLAGDVVRQHQCYVLQRLVPLLAQLPGTTQQQAAALHTALERCKPGDT